LDTVPHISYVKPYGAFYIMVDVRDLGLKGTEFSKRLLEEKYVATVPAIGLGETSDSFVRFSYAASQADIREGMQRIREFVKAL
jgi:aminotransferase